VAVGVPTRSACQGEGRSSIHALPELLQTVQRRSGQLSVWKGLVCLGTHIEKGSWRQAGDDLVKVD
jgi:hypothetical protein